VDQYEQLFARMSGQASPTESRPAEASQPVEDLQKQT